MVSLLFKNGAENAAVAIRCLFYKIHDCEVPHIFAVWKLFRFVTIRTILRALTKRPFCT